MSLPFNSHTLAVIGSEFDKSRVHAQVFLCNIDAPRRAPGAKAMISEAGGQTRMNPRHTSTPHRLEHRSWELGRPGSTEPTLEALRAPTHRQNGHDEHKSHNYCKLAHQP